jgi:hypothetical protein
MPVYDSGFKIVARASGRELAEVAGLACSHWRPIVSEVQVTERFADRAFRATYQGERCVVYFEAYVHWRKKALGNVLAKAGMLSEREKLPTLSILYLLRRRGTEALDGQFRLEVGGQPTQQLWYFPVALCLTPESHQAMLSNVKKLALLTAVLGLAALATCLTTETAEAGTITGPRPGQGVVLSGARARPVF